MGTWEKVVTVRNEELKRDGWYIINTVTNVVLDLLCFPVVARAWSWRGLYEYVD